MAISCSVCGVTSDDDAPLDWSFSVDRGRPAHQCPDCARTNIRAIEGKLPEEWWE